MSLQHQGGRSEADNKTDSPANTYRETEYNSVIKKTLKEQFNDYNPIVIVIAFMNIMHKNKIKW